jgi:hypothetical protein
MTLRQHFLEIKHQYFPRWDREDRWRISTSRGDDGYTGIAMLNAG